MKNKQVIKTKSIQAPKVVSDGLRICVMRRVKPEYDFDIWMPKLSPSERLLKAYVIDKKMTWEEFTPRFLRQLGRQKRLLKVLSVILEHQNITLLCWEEQPNGCHRSLLLSEFKKQYPQATTSLG